MGFSVFFSFVIQNSGDGDDDAFLAVLKICHGYYSDYWGSITKQLSMGKVHIAASFVIKFAEEN